MEAYVLAAQRKSDLDRTDLAKEKTGTFTGAYAINPVNGERIPIWIADYVLVRYGTGAIMAVPAHDARDAAFAAKFALPSRQVVRPVADGVVDTDGVFSANGKTTPLRSFLAVLDRRRRWTDTGAPAIGLCPYARGARNGAPPPQVALWRFGLMSRVVADGLMACSVLGVLLS